MVTFLGKGAEPGPALQDLVSSLAVCLPLSAAIRFLPRFMAPVPGPPLRNQRSALVLPAAKTEKAAANSEARGTAKGACGPLWKPRRSDGVARDGLRSSQGKGSLLQYRLFAAGKAHPGSRSETPPAFAGGPVCGKHLPYFSSGQRPRNTTIFHFYFLIFNFLRFFNFSFS